MKFCTSDDADVPLPPRSGGEGPGVGGNSSKQKEPSTPTLPAARKSSQGEGKRARSPDPTPLLRWMSDMLCLWSLCANAACRRSRACARNPRECLARCAPLTPEAAREGAKLMLDGLGQGLGYDALREKAPEEIAAVEDWIARVEAARAAAAAGFRRP